MSATVRPRKDQLRMTADTLLSLDEAHLHFAKKIHGQVWELLEKEARSSDEERRMLNRAHASLYHWLQAGTGLHEQRGEWLIARVQAVLDNGTEAVRHAQRCQQLTEEHKELMEDFDHAYSYEALARAMVVSGKRERAVDFYKQAENAGNKIADEENKEYFLQDLKGGDWKGIFD
jgi:hypothetical protein